MTKKILKMTHFIKRYAVEYTSLEQRNAFSASPLTGRMGDFNEETEATGVNAEKRWVDCDKCGGFFFACPGHGIYVQVDTPTKKNVSFINPNGFDIIKRLVGLFCFGCGKAFAPWEFFPKSGRTKLVELTKKSTSYKCGCEESVPVSVSAKSDPAQMIKIDNVEVDPARIRDFLEKIEDRYYKIFGLNKESCKNIIMNHIYVPPRCMFPRGFARNQTCESPMYQEIKRLYETAVGKTSQKLNIQQEYRGILVKNTNQNKQTKPHNDQMGTKQGFFRNIAEARRTSNIGRGVLNPADQHFGYIGIPKEAKNLQVMEKINVLNYEDVNRLREEGEITHQWITASKTTKRIHPSTRLAIGDIVLRRIREGDTVLFCRQPVLHSHSIVAYTATFSEGKTIEIHSSNTTHHGADFDGDEGNIHVVSRTAGRVELAILAHTTQIVTGMQNSKPMMGIVFNGISGGYLLSIRETLPDRTVKMLLSKISHPYSERYEERLAKHGIAANSGKGIISLIFPPTFTYITEKSAKSDGITIIDGIFIRGALTKKELAETRNGLVHRLFLRYNSIIASRFISDGQFLFVAYLSTYGLSLSFDNYLMNLLPDDWDKRVDEVDKIVREIEQEKAKVSGGEARKLDSILKSHIASLTQYPMDKLETIDPNLELMIMAKKSQARGDAGNIVQVVASVGQQYNYGQRLNYNHRFPRTCIYHQAWSHGIREHGFIDRGFVWGLEPDQYWNLMYGTRESIINVYLSTPNSGQKAREMSIHLSEIHINELGEIRGNSNVLLMTTYGSGANPAYVSQVKTKRGVQDTVFDVADIIDEINRRYEFDRDSQPLEDEN